MIPKPSSSTNAAAMAGNTTPSTTRPGTPSLQNPQAKKKPRVQPPEDQQSLPDIATLPLPDLYKLCPGTTAKHVEFSIWTACFVQPHLNYFDLQHRFQDIIRHLCEGCAAHLLGTTPVKRQHLKTATKDCSRMVIVLEEISASALTAGHKALHGYALFVQACYISNIISVFAPRGDVNQSLPDVRKKFEATLLFLEEHYPKSLNSQSSSTKPQLESVKQSGTIISVSDSAGLTKTPVQPPANINSSFESTTANTEGSKQSPSKASSSRPLDHLLDQVKGLEVNLQDDTPLWDELIGIDELRETLEGKVQATQFPPLLVPAGRPKPRSAAHVGILLHGPTGTGKSTIPKSFAKRFSLPMFRLDLSIKGGLQGETENKLRLLFEELCGRAPCVLLMDEVESFLREIPSHDTSLASLVGLLKSLWGDLIAQDIPVYIFGTTNSPWSIPNREFSRRFQLEQLVGLPGAAARREILQSRLRSNYHCITSTELDILSLDSQGYTVGDVVQAVNNVYHKLTLEAYNATAWTEYKLDGLQTFVPAVISAGNKHCPYKDLTIEEKSRVRARDISAATLGRQFVGSSAMKRTVKDKDVEEHKLWASSGNRI